MESPQGKNWIAWLLAVVALVAIAAAIYLWMHPRVSTITKTQYQQVPQIRTVETVKRVYVPCPQAGLVALDKAEVAEKLDLPWLTGGDVAAAADGKGGNDGTYGSDVKAVAAELGLPSAATEPAAELPVPVAPVPGNAADLQVTATADLPESENGFDVVSVLNTRTGITVPVVKEKESPLFQLRHDFVAGLRYGVAAGDGPPRYTGTIYGSMEFLRMKAFHLIGYSEVNTDGSVKAQADLQYRK